MTSLCGTDGGDGGIASYGHIRMKEGRDKTQAGWGGPGFGGWAPRARSLPQGSPTECPVDFPGDSDDEASAYNAEDPHSIPRSGRSPGEGNDNPHQYSCLENSTDRGAWRAESMGLQELDTT